MDVFKALSAPSASDRIVTVGMHTCGEPVRIVLSGIDEHLEGERLLDKREDAKRRFDHLRKRIMLEPRGHGEMYGAILVRETELTRTGEGHIGVLFCHGEGYSTMCGHATLALGRFLIDTEDESLFATRSSLVHDVSTSTTQVNLHAPCGLVEISVPTLLENGKIRYDASRRVSFMSVPSFAAAIDLDVEVGESFGWPELGDRKSIKLDVAYGGAFYSIVSAKELGFPNGLRGSPLELAALSFATAQLKRLVTAHYPSTFQHPTEPTLSFSYGSVVVDEDVAEDGGETGACFFADQQLDRSPTGSAVGARIALAYLQGVVKIGERRRYHSILSLHSSDDAFVGEAVEEVEIEGANGKKGIRVKTSGRGFYTDAAVFSAEPDDTLTFAGFKVELPK